jgi:hypothetical protein
MKLICDRAISVLISMHLEPGSVDEFESLMAGDNAG